MNPTDPHLLTRQMQAMNLDADEDARCECPENIRLGKVCEHGRLQRQCPECELLEEIRELRSALAEELARGAVWRLAALNLYTDLDSLYHGGRWPPEIKAAAAAVLGAETSPAVEALLELAEAAGAMEESGITDQMTPDRDVVRFRAAVKRLKEVRHGMG